MTNTALIHIYIDLITKLIFYLYLINLIQNFFNFINKFIYY